MISVPPLTLIGMSYENKKNVHLQRHLGAFSSPKKFGKFWYEISWQNLIQKWQWGGKVPSFMPIRVNLTTYLELLSL